jgi:hypothetical protein
VAFVKDIIGRITKGNITLTEYDNTTEKQPSYYLQCGIVGFLMSRQEFDDLKKTLLLIDLLEDYDEFKIKVGNSYVAIQ